MKKFVATLVILFIMLSVYITNLVIDVAMAINNGHFVSVIIAFVISAGLMITYYCLTKGENKND